MLEVEELGPATAYKLAELGRSTQPDAWTAEVEDFVYGAGAADVMLSGAGHVLLLLRDGTPVGAAVHRPHAQFAGTQHLSALVLAPEHRGHGLGEPAMAAVVDDAHSRSGLAHVLWLVHIENAAMRAVSERIADEQGYPDGDYLVFVHDR